MSVYRKLFLYAQRYASRIEWQPQPSWEFDGIAAEILYAAGTGTFVSDTTLYGTKATITYTGNTGLISFPRTFDGVAAALSYTFNVGTLDSELLLIPVTSMQWSLSRNDIGARLAQNHIDATLARNDISARLH